MMMSERGCRHDFMSDPSSGTTYCTKCGTVAEENAIVHEVTFGETSGGAAVVNGSHVASGATRARMNTHWGHKGSAEARQQAESKASQMFQHLRNFLGVREDITNAAFQMWKLAYQQNFTKGRGSVVVCGACCYAAIRRLEKDDKGNRIPKDIPVMLIDISDLIRVNVFDLGTVYLQLVQLLGIRVDYIFDPAFYVKRFARLLEFGDDQQKIAEDAVKIVKRFSHDWLHYGRRPSGICGAALLIAARMNNYRRSVLEVVQVVKIADTTLKKRLEEFKATPSANFSIEEFRQAWLEPAEEDPPSYKKALEKASGKENAKAAKSKKRKREGEDEGEGEGEVEVTAAVTPTAGLTPTPRQSPAAERGTPGGPVSPDGSDRQLDDLLQEFAEGKSSSGDPSSSTSGSIDPLFLPEGDLGTVASAVEAGARSESVVSQPLNRFQTEDIDPLIEAAIGQDIMQELDPEHNPAIRADLDTIRKLDEEQQARARAPPATDDFLGLNEDELDMYILTDQEVEAKERVWVELNRAYLEEVAAKEALAQGEPQPPKKPSSKKRARIQRDSTTARGATPAEAAMSIIRVSSKTATVSKSKRINYDALMRLFADDPVPGDGDGGGGGGGGGGGEEAEKDLGFDKEEMMDEEEMEMEVIQEDDVLPGRGMGLHFGVSFGDDGYPDDGYEEEV